MAPPARVHRLQRPVPRRGWLAWLAGGLLAVLLLGGAGVVLRDWPGWRAEARLATAQAARAACACRLIASRPLADCQHDLAGSRLPLRLSEEPATATVQASVILLARDSAQFRPGWGCQPAPWPG